MSCQLEAKEEEPTSPGEENDSNSFSGCEDELDFEGDDEEEEEGTKTSKGNSDKGTVKKRKKGDPTKRKRIRRVLREDELEKETVAAQLEERERLRRLELQRSLATEPVVAASSSPENLSPVHSTRIASPQVVDVRVKNKEKPSVIVIDSDDQDEHPGEERNCVCVNPPKSSSRSNDECIEIISSGSEESSECSDEGDYENCGKYVDDVINQPDTQGRVLVNVNHPVNEKDIFLAPQLARAVKPHQVM